MKKILHHFTHCTVFVGLLILMLFFLSKVAVPKANVKEQGMEDPMANGILSEPENTLDVVVLGDSETYCAISPLRIYEQKGITSYICGTSGQKLWYSEEFLYKTFQSQNPKLVILETDNIFKEFKYSDAAVHKADRVFPVFRYHNRWKNLSHRDFKFAVRYTYIENSKGYSFNTAVVEADDTDYMQPTNECAEYPVNNKNYIKNMKEFCEKNGTDFLLLSTPSTVNWSCAKHNTVQQIADELGIEYIDLNMMREQVPINWKKDSRDGGDHLNHYGATKVSDFLAEYLAAKGTFPDHSKDSDYDAWNEALAEFKENSKGN